MTIMNTKFMTLLKKETFHDKFFNCVVIGNDVVGALSAHIVDEVNVNESRVPNSKP